MVCQVVCLIYSSQARVVFYLISASFRWSHTRCPRGPSCNSRFCGEHVTLAMALIVQTLPHVFWEHMPASLGLWILRGRASFGMKIPHHFPKWVFILFLTHTASASPCPDDSISHLHSLPGTFPSGVLSYPSFCFNIFILKCIQYAI